MHDYAGIGSRQTPEEILRLMSKLAKDLRDRRWVLRSGGAIGADLAWERGSKGRNYILRPRDTTEEAMAIAAKHHPAWHNCDEYARLLHGRNAMIILGSNLQSPVQFVGCWTSNGKDQGGTGLGIRIAQAHGIPVFNLFHAEDEHKLKDFAERLSA